MAQTSFNKKATNLWTSRIIPVILIGIVGYVTWVVIVLICANYLLKPPAFIHTPRQGVAIAILILYTVLLLFIALTYFRLLYTVTFNPGYVSRGPQWYAQEEQSTRHIVRRGGKHSKRSSHSSSARATEKTNGNVRRSRGGDSNLPSTAYTNGAQAAATTTGPEPELRDFFTRDAFVCQGDGRPIWCSTCLNYKPDRAHHCSEIERCVPKMDHFCPWVGGVVSENSFKFFVQFVAWTAAYCIFNLIVAAYFLAEYRRKTKSIDIHWLVTMCLAALFGTFTFGMTASSLQFAIINTTTIENLSRKSIVWSLALYMPRLPETAPGFKTISFFAGRVLEDSDAAADPPPHAVRTFAILHTKPGENPFDLGPYRNFKSVMGNHWYDWFLPLKHSPCCDHDRSEGQFEMGPVVQRMRREAGITLLDEEEGEDTRRRRRRRRRRHESDTAKTRHISLAQDGGMNEKDGQEKGPDANDADLESGLAPTNGPVH